MMQRLDEYAVELFEKVLPIIESQTKEWDDVYNLKVDILEYIQTAKINVDKDKSVQ